MFAQSVRMNGPKNHRASTEQKPSVCDASENVLNDGNSIMVIEDLKVKGTSTVVKVGTKVR